MTKQEDVRLFREYAKRVIRDSELQRECDKLKEKIIELRQIRDLTYNKLNSRIRSQKRKIEQLTNIIVNERIKEKQRDSK